MGIVRTGIRKRKGEQSGRQNLGEWIPTYWNDFLLQTKASDEIILYKAKTKTKNTSWVIFLDYMTLLDI